jgi:hypothetical protein
VKTGRDPYGRLLQLSRGRVAVYWGTYRKGVARTTVIVFKSDGSRDLGFGVKGIATVPLAADQATVLTGGQLVFASTETDEATEEKRVTTKVLTSHGHQARAWGDHGNLRIDGPPKRVADAIRRSVGSDVVAGGVDYLEIAALAPTDKGGFSLVIETGFGRDDSVRWFATVRKSAKSIDIAASQFLANVAPLDSTDAEYNTYWSLPDRLGGWVNVGFEYTGSAGLWADRVSKLGKTRSTLGNQTRFRDDTEVSHVSLTPDSRQLIGCGLTHAGPTRKPVIRGFVFKMRVK